MKCYQCCEEVELTKEYLEHIKWSGCWFDPFRFWSWTRLTTIEQVSLDASLYADSKVATMTTNAPTTSSMTSTTTTTQSNSTAPIVTSTMATIMNTTDPSANVTTTTTIDQVMTTFALTTTAVVDSDPNCRKWRQTLNLVGFPASVKCAENCAELYDRGVTTSGVYRISPQPKIWFDVYCDQETDGGGWTIIQRRMNGNVSFDQDWSSYKRGNGRQNWSSYQFYWAALSILIYQFELFLFFGKFYGSQLTDLAI